MRPQLIAALLVAVAAGPLRGLEPVAPTQDLCELLPPEDQPVNPKADDLREALLDQAKNIFFGSMEVDEWTWDAGKVGGIVDDVVYDPFVSYLEAKTKGELAAEDDLDRRNAAINAFFKGAAKIVCKPLDVAITAGNVVVAGVAWTVEEIQVPYNPSFGIGVNFWLTQPQFRNGDTCENLGQRIQTRADLERRWDTFRTLTKGLYPDSSSREAFYSAQHAQVLECWQRSHGRYVLQRFHDELASRLAKARVAIPPRGIYGLWRTPGGSIVALSESGGAAQVKFCRVSYTASQNGFRSGQMLYTAGQVDGAAAADGRTAVGFRVKSRPLPGECPGLAPKDLGPGSVMLRYDPEADTIEGSEMYAYYDKTTCKWSEGSYEPEPFQWTRVQPGVR